MNQRIGLALGLLCGCVETVSAERWPGGDINFVMPEELESTRKLETLPNGAQKLSFQPELDGSSCAITLLPAINIERMLKSEPNIEAEDRKQLETLVENQRNFERDVAGDDELRYKVLQAMYIPYLADMVEARKLKELSLEQIGLTFSESDVPLATTQTVVQGDGDPISIWATGVFANMTMHITLVETPHAGSEACASVMEELLASYAAP